jgi:hypothetical protein
MRDVLAFTTTTHESNPTRVETSGSSSYAAARRMNLFEILEEAIAVSEAIDASPRE